MSETAYLRPLTADRRREIDDFISRLSLMKLEALKLGLYRTHQALRLPVHTVGYELADLLSGTLSRIPEMKP